MPIFQLTVGQGRNRLKCLWFNATYLEGRFKPGQMLALYGKVEQDRDGEYKSSSHSLKSSATSMKKAAPTMPKKKPPPRSKSDASFPSTNRPARAS